jgi:hypothetical protein
MPRVHIEGWVEAHSAPVGPDQGLPGGGYIPGGGRPDNSLPGGGYIDNTLPGGGHVSGQPIYPGGYPGGGPVRPPHVWFPLPGTGLPGGPVKPPGRPILPPAPDQGLPPNGGLPPHPWLPGHWEILDPGFGKPPQIGFLPVDPGWGLPEAPPATPGQLPSGIGPGQLPSGGGSWVPTDPDYGIPDRCPGGKPHPPIWAFIPAPPDFSKPAPVPEPK